MRDVVLATLDVAVLKIMKVTEIIQGGSDKLVQDSNIINEFVKTYEKGTKTTREQLRNR